MKKININLQNSSLSLSLSLDAVKSELSSTAQSIKKPAAFTLAEILLSLTVIGIVAAIALPSLLGNANERAWETQKKALYTRFSQALPLLPSLNGYGQLEGTLSSSSEDGKQHVDVDTAAESFVRDGLSKVMKITNICDNDHLSDCGLPDKIIPIDGGTALELSNIESLAKFNDRFNGKIQSTYWLGDSTYEQLDTKAAAFETTNGESVLVYYNPNCEPNYNLSINPIDNSGKEVYYFTQPKMCANFIYDLNGKKGPNVVGKDIGAITAFYSTDSIVVAPNPYSDDMVLSGSEFMRYTDANQRCREINGKLPNIEELMSVFTNMKLFNINDNDHWSSTSTALGMAWVQGFSLGGHKLSKYNDYKKTRCIKR